MAFAVTYTSDWASHTTYGTTPTNVIWGYWVDNTSSTTLYSYDSWTQWVQEGTVTYGSSYTPTPLTEEQIEANRVAAEARKVEAAIRVKQVEEAKVRARKLLLDLLEEEQKEELLRDGWFHVETRDGTRRYRLSPNSSPRRVHGEDGAQWSYCIHPDYGYPQDDIVLAQKLLLESDEEMFLKIANATRLTAR